MNSLLFKLLICQEVEEGDQDGMEEVVQTLVV